LAEPQAGHSSSIAEPQEPQKRLPAGFGAAQDGQATSDKRSPL
jgi:hypothetical protein